MFLILGVSLYTSRIILKALGVVDFGIYNLVGGVVVLFSFLNTAMSSSTQRFLNFEIGKKQNANVNKVFCISMNVHLLIAMLIVILAETIGLWFLNYKLQIPLERLHAANVIYQISILTTIINVLRVPYNAMIISHEKMSFYALLSIIETLAKLVVVYGLLIYGGDKLIMYSILLFGVVIMVNAAYYFYCKKQFKEFTHYRYIKDKTLFKEITVFSGWGLFGNVSLMTSNQGIAFILNMFIGVVINATMGIANQINAAVFSFISNLQVAFNPQIIQSYAENNLVKHKQLVLQASKFSYILMLIICVPILINTEEILMLWLGNVPMYTVEFTQLILLISLVDALAGPFWMSAHAVGNIKIYQLGISFFLILNLPLAYLFLYKGYSPLSVMIIKLILNFLTLVFRIVYIHIKIRIEHKELLNYLKHIFILFSATSGIMYLFSLLYKGSKSFFEIVSTSVLSDLLILIIVWFLVLTIGERSKVYFFVKKKVNKVFK